MTYIIDEFILNNASRNGQITDIAVSKILSNYTLPVIYLFF